VKVKCLPAWRTSLSLEREDEMSPFPGGRSRNALGFSGGDAPARGYAVSAGGEARRRGPSAGRSPWRLGHGARVQLGSRRYARTLRRRLRGRGLGEWRWSQDFSGARLRSRVAPEPPERGVGAGASTEALAECLETLADTCLKCFAQGLCAKCLDSYSRLLASVRKRFRTRA